MSALVPDRHGAHGEAIELAGRIYHIRRTFDLMVRIEERAGPLMTILRAINDGHHDVAMLPVAKLAEVYVAILDGENVPRHEIEDHILEIGPMRAMQPIARLIMNLFIGDERFQKRIKAATENADVDPLKAASYHGATSLERQAS